MACDQYCQTLQPYLQEYLQISKNIGGLVTEHADMVNQSFLAQADFLRKTERYSEEPSQAELVEILKPTLQQIQAIQSFREKNRSSLYFNHLSAVSESIPVLGWVAVKPTPSSFIKDMIDASQFYTNRVLKDSKEKDKIHVTWVKTWLKLLINLQELVKQIHTTGLVWNSKGGTPTDNHASVVPSASVTRPPVFTKDGKKWFIQYQKDNRDLIVDQVEMNNVVYMFECENCSLVVKGKLNSLVLNSCKKTSVVFDSLVASVEFINCQSIQMQVLGKVPTISVDKTDGCQMYLSKDSMDVEIISSKSTELNILIPNDNGDYTEHSVPEQFKTTFGPGGINTVIVDNKG